MERDILQALREALEAGTARHWEEFDDLARPVISRAIARKLSGSSRHNYTHVPDLTQETFAKLVADHRKVLRAFLGSDARSLECYLRTIAISIATDSLRASKTKIDSLDAPDGPNPPPDHGPQREIERNILMGHVKRCLQGQSERNQRIFWMYYESGQTPVEIAQDPSIGLSQSGVETLLYRVTQFIAKCIQKNHNSRGSSEGGGA